MRVSVPSTSESKTRRAVILGGILPDTTSWVRILEDGQIHNFQCRQGAGLLSFVLPLIPGRVKS